MPTRPFKASCARCNVARTEAASFASSARFASASVAFFFLYYIFFGIGFQGVPWLYPTEINSLSMRTKGAALGTATNWIVNFMVVEITPIGIQSLHWKFYIIWTVFNFSFVPLVYFFYPETSDRTLEDIDRFFRENQHVFVHRDPNAVQSKRPQAYVEHEQREMHRNSSIISGFDNEEARRQMVKRVNREMAEEKVAEEGSVAYEHQEKV